MFTQFRNILSWLLILFSTASFAQQQDVTKSVYNGETVISATRSITFLPGFTVPAGSNLRAYITGHLPDCSVPATGIPSANQNYVSTKIFRKVGVTDPNLSRQVCEVTQTIQYFDGLGRPSQSIQVQGSPTYKDIIQPIVYDQFGREGKKFLPYTAEGNNGSFRTDALSIQPGFYNSPPAGVTGITNAAFSQSVFEPSPLNRVTEQGSPGAQWQIGSGNTQKISYGANIGGEVKLWEVKGNTASSSSSYVAGTLYKTITTDENWKPAKLREGSVEEFKDKEGHVVLKRIWETNGKSLDTYYVYDDMLNLRYVLPPAVNPNGQSPVSSVTEGSTAFTGFIYGYHYDNKRRLTEKHVPGKGWEYLVYNNADQVVLSQDSRQQSQGKWIYSKYDILGRVTSTGIYTNGASNVSLQGIVNTETNLYESRAVNADYSNVAFPRDNAEVQSINYYDDYTFPGGNTFTASASGVMQGQTKGLQTGSKVKVLGTTATMLLSVNYYDNDARVKQAFKQHYQGGSIGADKYDEVINSWSFTGELEGTERNHHNGTAITQITTTTIYDHMGRKVKSFEKISNDNEVQLAGLTYNEVGQLLNKSLHSENDGASFLQSSGYAYNERGWMKGMNSAQFSFALDYADGTAAQFNGNIANQRWGAGSSLPNTFTYTYDALNRLAAGSAPGMSEQIGYDEMGNIRSMNRDGATGTYNYTGNKLNSISAGALATGSYVYDENGNATTDGRTGVNLSYNVLNLPATANKSGLSMSYVYSADGAKLRKESNVTGNRDYVDGIEYNGSEIDIIHTEEGVARRNGSSYAYEYNLTDHLGNVRYTFNKHPTTGALQRLQGDDYYAFGLRKSNSPVSQNNKYLYNGKELQDELGQYDYGARFYDPVIGRWNVVDPLSEGMRKFSPYVYCGNNPIRFVDPDGMFFNEYEVVVQGGKVQSTTMTGTKGGDVTDYVKVVNLDAAPYSSGITNYTVDVQTGYTSGVAADEGEGSQKRHPSPGVRQKHGGMPTDIQAYFWLTTGLFSRAAAIVDGAGAFAANGVLKPLGLGSTGRVAAANLTEQLAMKEIISNPTLGKTVMTGMKDSRWFGWNKMQYTHIALDGTKTTIHYVGKMVNGVLKAVDDFKFVSP